MKRATVIRKTIRLSLAFSVFSLFTFCTVRVTFSYRFILIWWWKSGAWHESQRLPPEECYRWNAMVKWNWYVISLEIKCTKNRWYGIMSETADQLLRSGAAFSKPLDQHGNVSGGRVAELSHQGDQNLVTSGLPEEWMVQQLWCCGSLSRISDQHFVQKALKPRTDLKFDQKF